jgi:hypothetical protein
MVHEPCREGEAQYYAGPGRIGNQDMMHIENSQIVPLYLLLKRREEELDRNLQVLYHKLQRELFSILSIEEMESLEELYRDDVEVLEKRGYV